MKKIISILWLVSGILVIAILSFGLSTTIGVWAATRSLSDLSSQVTIDDVRHALDIAEKQIDNESALRIVPLEDNDYTRALFIDFCGRTGYVSTNPDNYLRFRYGKLTP